MLEALRQLCRGSGGASVVRTLASQAPTWLAQFPALIKRRHREMLQREILGATRERMLREIGDALEAIASAGPLLLVFEDLQWMDSSTVDLISALARRGGPAKLLVLGTYRPADLESSSHPLKALTEDLLVHRLCREIALEPLTEAEIAAYLASDASEISPPETLAKLLYHRSEGNPLFMVAALEHLVERGVISREQGHWQLRVAPEKIDPGVPKNLHRMIATQIDRLSLEEQGALEAACVEGVLFSASVSAKVAALDEEKFEDLCEGLSRRQHMVRRAGSRQFPDRTVSSRYEFAHALYREVCYRRLAHGYRAKLHLRVGERLEELFSQHENEVVTEMAEHFEHGGDWPRAIKYLQLAADTAGRRFEPRQAEEILKRALDLVKKLPDAERGVTETGILEKLAGIYSASGDARAAETWAALSARAGEYGLIDVEARALAERAFLESWQSSKHGLELLERAFHLALKLDPVKHVPTHATCLFCRLLLFGWNPRHADEYQKAIDEIRASGPIAGSHLLDYSCIQWCSSEYRASHRSYGDGLKMLLDAGTVHPSLSGIRWGVWQHVHTFDLQFLGEWGEASQELEHAISTPQRNEDYLVRAHALQVCRAWLHLQACDFAGVLAICESAVPLIRDPALRLASGSPPPFPWPFRQSLVLRGSAEVALGRYDRAREYLFAARDEMDRQKTAYDWYWRIPLEFALTELWLAERNLAQARSQAERFLSVTLATAERTWQALAWEANARVAMAELDSNRAQECITQGLSAMEGFEVPLAAWRVHATAFELYRNSGGRELAEHHLELSRETIMKLANSLPAEEQLRQIFLSAPPIRKILEDGPPRSRAKEA
jgi:tetratricopeptide (TPR) repeat protein